MSIPAKQITEANSIATALMLVPMLLVCISSSAWS